MGLNGFPTPLHPNIKRCVNFGESVVPFSDVLRDLFCFFNVLKLSYPQRCFLPFCSSLRVGTLPQASHPFTHLSRPDILSRYQHFSKLLVSAIAPLLSTGLLRFLTRCTFILPAPPACSPGAQLPSKYTEILSPAEVTLQCSQRGIYRPEKFPAYLPLH